MEINKKRIRFLRENKCSENGCYNFREPGVIYCIHHLHGYPRKMDNNEILILQFTDGLCVCENPSSKRNDICRNCGLDLNYASLERVHDINIVD